MKTYNLKEVKNILSNNGFQFCYQNGNHLIYKKNNQHITITRTINKMVFQRLIKEYDLTI